MASACGFPSSNLHQGLVVVEHLGTAVGAHRERSGLEVAFAFACRSYCSVGGGVAALTGSCVSPELEAGVVRDIRGALSFGSLAAAHRHAVDPGRDLVGFGQFREGFRRSAPASSRAVPRLSSAVASSRRPGAALLPRQPRRLREQLRGPLVVAVEESDLTRPVEGDRARGHLARPLVRGGARAVEVAREAPQVLPGRVQEGTRPTVGVDVRRPRRRSAASPFPRSSSAIAARRGAACSGQSSISACGRMSTNPAGRASSASSGRPARMRSRRRSQPGHQR